MAKDVRTIFLSSGDDAAQRAWVASIIAAFQAVGLVQTADTGQFNPASAARSASNASTGAENVYQGYLMFRLSDALQATAPVFIRMNIYVSFHYDQYYGYGNAGHPAAYFTVGRATDGAGNFIGVKTNNLRWFSQHGNLSIYNSNMGYSNNGNAYNSCQTWTCGDGSSIQCVLGAQNTQQMYYTQGNNPGALNAYGAYPAILWIERTRNPDGTPNGNGLIVATSCWPSVSNVMATAPSPNVQTLSFLTLNQVTVQEGFWPITWPGGNGFSTSTQGPDLAVLPPQLASPKTEFGMGFLGIYKNDLALGSTVQLLHLGTERTYISLAGITGHANGENNRTAVNNFATNGALLMRWE